MSGEHILASVPRVPVAVQRVVRQLVQTYGPVILVVLTAPDRPNDLAAVFASLGFVLVVTTLKVLAKVKTGPGSPWYLVVLDRAGSAAAAVVIGTGLTSLVGLLTIDWVEVGGAAALAGLTALVMVFYVPPVEPDPTPAVEAAGRSDVTVTDPGLF